MKRILKIVLISAAAILLVVILAVVSLRIYFTPAVHRTNGVQYGQRNGHPLTLDVFQPSHPCGIGIIVMVSGGWKSAGPGALPNWWVAPFLRRGYTVFAISHLSQPGASVMEIVQEVNRAVRYIRHNASQYGIDPNHLGAVGASSGGHLCLMLATRGGSGPADAADSVDRESSAVQAVAIFFPPTDLLNLGSSTENPGDGGPPKHFAAAFGEGATNLIAWKSIGRDLSPIYFVHSNLPPVLILHGDKDTLVPLDQSQRFQAEAQKYGCTVRIEIQHGAGHGWQTMVLDFRQFADWFDRYLRQEKK